MNVAEGSRITLEQHGKAIFNKCNEIAVAMNMPLTIPEKFLIQSAAYLHDLGYFAAYSGSRAHEKAGLNLLKEHGKDTADLLYNHFRENPKSKDRIVPRTYAPETGETLRQMLISLCRYHSFPVLSKDDQQTQELRKTTTVRIGEFDTPIRFDLVHALFVAAEELSEGHPFHPSPYPLEGMPLDQAIEDPILSLYLDQKRREISFVIEPRKIIAIVAPGEIRSTTAWLCAIAKDAVRQLDRVAKGKNSEYTKPEKGDDKKEKWSIEFLLRLPPGIESEGEGNETKEQPSIGSESGKDYIRSLERKVKDAYIPGRWDYEDLIRGALEERLSAILDESKKEKIGLAASILDLMAIYTLPEEMNDAEGKALEPRVHIASSDVVQRAYKTYKDLNDKSHRGLLDLYFDKKIQRETGETSTSHRMDDLFLNSFNNVYYPAWRFCAKSWHAGNDPVCMARVSLDLGSSRYRGEVISGLRYLISDKIQLEGNNGNCWAYGHDRCMLCTSRLLYILSCARSLFSTEYLNLVASHQNLDRGSSVGRLDPGSIVDRLLSYMLSLGADHPGWWGVPETKNNHSANRVTRKGIKSADYVAWAIRSLAFTLPVVKELAKIGDKTWEEKIPAERQKTMIARLRELLGQLVKDKTPDTLLSPSAEEPHPYILGELATTYLLLEDLDARHSDLGLLAGFDLSEHAQCLNDAVKKLGFDSQPHLSRFFLWPALVFLHQSGILSDKERSNYETYMTTTLEDCVPNPIWIQQGGGSGSWGNNLENTQRIVSSLNTFWRYAYKNEKNKETFESLLSRG
jgi:hypothetical protein